MTHNKNRTYIALVVVLVLVVLGWLLFRNGPGDGTTPEGPEPVAGQEVTVIGEIACLPYHITVAGQGCVKGVKSVDGRMYSLNSPKGLENKFGEGQDVTAVGIYEPAVTSVDESSVFDYDAVLVLKSLNER